MISKLPSRWILSLACFMSGLVPEIATAASTVYAPPTVAQCRDLVQSWMAKRAVPADKSAAILQSTISSLPDSASVTVRLEAVIEAFALADSETRQIIDAIAVVNESSSVETSDFQSRHDELFYINNLRLLYARALSSWSRYDEALEIYSEIDPQHVVDPAGALFHRAVCETALLQKEAALTSLDRHCMKQSKPPRDM